MQKRAALVVSSIALVTGFSMSTSAAQVAIPEVVETAQLPTDAFAIGADGLGTLALPSNLWQGSDPQTLTVLLDNAPTRPASPSLGAAMRRVLLSSGTLPGGVDASLGGKKLQVLARAGFIEEAQSIASLATSGRSNLDVLQARATIELLTGNLDGACRRSAGLSAGREALFWVKLRALCYAQAGELDAFDLTLNLLREGGVLSDVDEAYLLAAATGAAPIEKILPPLQSALHYGAAGVAEIAIQPSYLRNADGGVVAAVAEDETAAPATRMSAAQSAIAMGVLPPETLAQLFSAVEFDLTDLGSAVDVAAARPQDPMTDALLYQSIKAMSAPEFIRDKARRIALAISRADRFERAYALSLLYADEINALEGVLVAPEEASQFALARMAVDDSVGAGQWLSTMIGTNQSVAALPEAQGLEFIDRVNLLAVLDPQTASRIARSAGVAVLLDDPRVSSGARAHADPTVMVRILEAAFDAVAGDKSGQAGLVALAASAGQGAAQGDVETVIVEQGLAAAGLADLARRHSFERAWASSFSGASSVTSVTENQPSNAEDAASGVTPASYTPDANEGGFTPRLKPNQTD